MISLNRFHFSLIKYKSRKYKLIINIYLHKALRLLLPNPIWGYSTAGYSIWSLFPELQNYNEKVKRSNSFLFIQILTLHLFSKKKMGKKKYLLFICVIFDSEIKLEEAAILHYTYPKFSDLTSRRDRCGCKPTKEDVKRCFMLEFDRAVSLNMFQSLVFFVLFIFVLHMLP